MSSKKKTIKEKEEDVNELVIYVLSSKIRTNILRSLKELKDRGAFGVSPVRLREKLGIKSGTFYVYIRLLEKKGLLKRLKRYRNYVAITELGEKVIERINKSFNPIL